MSGYYPWPPDDFSYTQSAFKHGLSQEDIEHATETAVAIGVEASDPKHRVWVIGEDRAGRLLELLFVDSDNDGLILIHAQKLRPATRNLIKSINS